MDVDDHDAAVARVSHLPHLMSVLIASRLIAIPERDLTLAGQGLRDVTRIAASDPALWEQIVGANSDAVLEELRGVQDQLGLLIKAVEASPATDDLRSQLERAVAGTRKIAGKHGAAAIRYSEVVVAIPDEPGALARLFGDVSAAGVNVEDISIEHDPVRELGYLALSVAPEHADALLETMLSHGWIVSDVRRYALSACLGAMTDPYQTPMGLSGRGVESAAGHCHRRAQWLRQVEYSQKSQSSSGWPSWTLVRCIGRSPGWRAERRPGYQTAVAGF
jgi:hypothetical protein